MSSLICGSLAYDTIMSFPERFSESILADQLHNINVCFLVPSMRREFGGCAGNTAGLSKLVEGMPAREVIARLKGIPCGLRGTSCPDQLAAALEKNL